MSSEGISPIKVTQQQIFQGKKASELTNEEILKEFDSLVPPTKPREPLNFNPTLAQENSQPSLLDLSQVSEENEAKQKAIGKRTLEFLNFAKKHPFLTLGIVVSCVLLFLSYQTLSLSLSQYSSLDILHAHLVVGGGISFMFLYYAVMLHNMRKRAAAIDEWEIKIQSAHQLIETLVKSKEGETDQVLANFNRDIREIHKGNILKLKEAEQNLKDTEKNNSLVQSIGQKVSSSNDTLQKLFYNLIKDKGPPELAKKISLEHEIVTTDIKKGAEVMGSALIPLMPVISLPDKTHETPAVQQKQRDKLSKLFSSLFQNPGAKTYYVIGFTILALAGVGLYYWLNGYSNVYFFGMLSLSTLIPIAIYGISLIYEGWNSASLNDLKRLYDAESKDVEEKKRALAKEESQIALIRESSQKTLQKFQEDWKVILDSASKMPQSVQASQSSMLQQLEFISENIASFISGLAQTNKEEVLPIVNSKLGPLTEYVQKQTS